MRLNHAHRVFHNRDDDVKDEHELSDDKYEEQPRLRRKNTTSGIKMKILTFKCSSSPEEYLEWV